MAPFTAGADLNIENQGQARVSNSIEVKADSGGRQPGQSGQAEAEITVETVINGQKAVSENIRKSGTSVDIKLESVVKAGGQEQDLTVLKKEVKAEADQPAKSKLSENVYEPSGTLLKTKEQETGIKNDQDIEDAGKAAIAGSEEEDRQDALPEPEQPVFEAKAGFLPALSRYFVNLFSRILKLFT